MNVILRFFAALIATVAVVYSGSNDDKPDFSLFSLGNADAAFQTRPGRCIDRMGMCFRYKKYCLTYPTVLSHHCPKTCNKCPPKPKPIPNAGSCGNVPKRKDGSHKKLIVSGKNAKQGYYPWQVAIYSGSNFLCGGSLIDNRNVLTAAHCFKPSDKAKTFKVTLGTHNRDYPISGIEKTLGIKRITLHERFKQSTVVNDIAILQLESKVDFSDYIQPICLPVENEVRPVGSACAVTGWGEKYTRNKPVPILQEITYPIVSRTRCRGINNNNININRVITDDMICTGTYDGYMFKSTCQGNSGGPLSCLDESSGKWKLFGIVSWGSPTCNALQMFNVYTEVSKYISWINEHRHQQ